MNNVAIIQARVGSTRLRNKVFAEIAGFPLLYHVVKRLSVSKHIQKVVVATTSEFQDDAIADWCDEYGIFCFRGDEENVLSRYYHCALEYEAHEIIRITADDPFKDGKIIDQVIELRRKQGLDFAFNNQPASFPEGLDTEVFTMDALKRAFENAQSDFEKEHVTQYFYLNPKEFKMENLSYLEDLSQLRWTIDTEDDLQMTREVYQHLFFVKPLFGMLDILELLKNHPHIAEINTHVQRSSMYKKSENK